MPLPLILSYVANNGAIRRHVSIDWDELPRDSYRPLAVDLPDFAAIEKSPKSAAEKAQKREDFCRAVLYSVIRRISIPLLLAFIAAASNPLGKCADISITAGGRKYRFGGFMPSGKPLLYDIREVESILDRRDWISSVLAAQMVELLEDLKSEASESPTEDSPSAEIVPIPGVSEEWLPVQSAVDLPFTGSACSFDKSTSDDKSEKIAGQVDSSVSPGLEPPDIPWRWSFGAVPFQVDSNSIPGFQDSSSSESGDIKGLQHRLNLEMEMKSPEKWGQLAKGRLVPHSAKTAQQVSFHREPLRLHFRPPPLFFASPSIRIFTGSWKSTGSLCQCKFGVKKLRSFSRRSSRYGNTTG